MWLLSDTTFIVIGHNTKALKQKKGRISLKMGRSALFFDRIVQKSIKMGGGICIKYPFYEKKMAKKFGVTGKCSIFATSS